MRLIDADELKALYDDPEFAGEKWSVPIRVILANIDDMPTIYPVKHGRWVHYAHRELQYDISGVKSWGEEYQCSNCGFVHSVIEDFGHYAYCPNCGAHMMDGTQKKPCDDCQQFDCYGCEYAERNEDEAD